MYWFWLTVPKTFKLFKYALCEKSDHCLALSVTHSMHVLKFAQIVGFVKVVKCISFSCNMDLSKLKYTWISLSCYMDLSKLISVCWICRN